MTSLSGVVPFPLAGLGPSPADCGNSPLYGPAAFSPAHCGGLASPPTNKYSLMSDTAENLNPESPGQAKVPFNLTL